MLTKTGDDDSTVEKRKNGSRVFLIENFNVSQCGRTYDQPLGLTEMMIRWRAL